MEGEGGKRDLKRVKDGIRWIYEGFSSFHSPCSPDYVWTQCEGNKFSKIITCLILHKNILCSSVRLIRKLLNERETKGIQRECYRVIPNLLSHKYLRNFFLCSASCSVVRAGVIKLNSFSIKISQEISQRCFHIVIEVSKSLSLVYFIFLQAILDRLKSVLLLKQIKFT